MCRLGGSELRQLHTIHLMGVSGTQHLVRKADSEFTKQSIQKLVGSCGCAPVKTNLISRAQLKTIRNGCDALLLGDVSLDD